MSVGLILLVIVTVLILFGLAQRVLDKLRLSDKMALLFTAAIFVGGLIPDIPLGGPVYVNLGGAIVPLALCIYLLCKAGTGKEIARALIGAAITGLLVYWLGHAMPNEPEAIVFDPNYIYGLVGGLVAYLIGKSRRGAFIAGVLGVMGADIAQAIMLWSRGINQELHLGGAGAVDVIVIAGLTAVLLAEIVGEIIERCMRGKHKPEDREFVDGDIKPVDKRGDSNEK